MLMHHGSKDYNEAASEAAKHARDIMEGMFETGRQRGARIIEKVMTEVPQDYIMRGSTIKFDGDIDNRRVGDSTELMIGARVADFNIALEVQKFSMQQICSRANIPIRYAEYLKEKERIGWGQKLLAHNLNELYSREKSNFLLRSYDGRLRGFLSDRYRRLDSRPLLDAFCGESEKYGLVPVEGYSSETKVAMKALLPRVFEPVPNEVMAFGVMWENSDYGNGAHTIRAFALRLWCTNYAITEIGFRQVHLGRRLSDDINWSKNTYDMDTKATASQIKDIVGQGVSPDATNSFCEVIKMAHEKQIDPKKVVLDLSKHLTKGEVDMVREKYNEPDVVALPPGNTVWRMSNAISWVAGNKIDDSERKIEVMRVAGGLLEKVSKYN